MESGSVPALFREAVEKFGDRVALREKDLGIWQEITWRQYGQRVEWACLALRSLGFEPGQRVSILSENKPEWFICDLGCEAAGGTTVGVYTTNSPFEVKYIVEHSESRVLFVEDEEQLDKVLEVWPDLPNLNWVVVFDMEGLRHLDHSQVLSYDAFIERGQQYEQSHPDEYDRLVDAVDPESTAIFIYTSGTTGMPKGAMLSHRNIVWTIRCLNSLWDSNVNDVLLSFLPLSHIAERSTSHFGPILSGAVVNFAENMETVPENLREVQPTIFFAVPRFWEKFYSTVFLQMKDAIWFARFMFNWGIKIGRKKAELKIANQPIPLGLRLKYALMSQLVFKNIRRSLGMDRARILVSGGAPVSPEILKFFNALGVELREVYGQTEDCGPTSIHREGDIVIGTVGKPVPGVEVKIAADGEILVKGPNVFQGYFKNPELTAETIVDGWLHSGDVGTFDEQGNLMITDRKKDIIITSGGKNITPQHIENELKFSPYVSDAVIVGDRRKYLTSLVMLDEDNVMKYAQDERIPFTTYKSLTETPEIIKLIQGEVEAVNKILARVEQIKKFRLLDIKLTSEDGELTATMKLKRKHINEKYKGLIESMY